MQDFFDVFSHVKNPQKTDNGEFVSAINCLKETALQQMILTKKQYQKTGGYIAWHGYQSFKPDEVTPEQCHEIELKTCEGNVGRQVPDNRCHPTLTGASPQSLLLQLCFLSGWEQIWITSKSEQKRLRETSDRLCREYGLSVIENPKKAPSRPLYLDEKSGKPDTLQRLSGRFSGGQSAAVGIFRTWWSI